METFEWEKYLELERENKDVFFGYHFQSPDCVLQASKSSQIDERLFIPFRDATSGKETYGVGCYLDLEIEKDYVEGKWIFDFNKA